jgi:hypothetical protein
MNVYSEDARPTGHSYRRVVDLVFCSFKSPSGRERTFASISRELVQKILQQNENSREGLGKLEEKKL